MRACLPRISLFLLAACVQLPAFAAQRGKAAFVPMALLLLAVPAACGFYVSPHAEWMVDNTIPRLAWYVAAIPLFELIGSGN